MRRPWTTSCGTTTCGGAAAGWLVLASCLASPALATGDGFAVERPLHPGARGANRIALDVDLLTRAKPVRYAADGADALPSGGLEDLRLFDAAGRELPYLLMLPGLARERDLDGAILAIPASKRESGFEVDLGQIENVDRLTLAGLASPLLKRYRLEGSGDRSHWVILVAEGTLFDLPGEGLQLLAADFTSGPYRYLRWTWDDATSGRVRPPSSARARLRERAEPPPPTMVRLAMERRPSEPRVSRFHLRMPGRGLPVAALLLDIGPGDLLRRARVTEPRLGGAGAAGAKGSDTIEPALLGEATLRRSSHGGSVAAALALAIAPPRETGLDLEVDDGDSGPLRLEGVVARLRPLPWIYFESPDGGEVLARYGRPAAAAPRYDLEASRGAAATAAAATARWGEPRLMSAAAAGAPAVAEPPAGGALATEGFLFERALAEVGVGLQQLPLDAAVLAHSHALADLRLATADGQQVPYLLELRAEPLELGLTLQAAADDRAGPARPTAEAVSRYAIALPFAGLPAGRLALATSARVFDRELVLRTSERDRATGGERWRTLAQLAWRHADPELAAPELAIDLPALAGDRLLLEVEEGDNRPLPLSAARLLLPSWQLRFFGTGLPLRLLYGEPRLASPRYDLALLAPRLVGVEGDELALPAERPLAAGSDSPSSGRWFWFGLVAAVVVLLGLLVRLLRGEAAAATTR